MIELHEVSFHHPEAPLILDRVSLQIRPQEKLALLGPNGSGKSTMLKILAGAWQPTDGRVLLDNEPVTYNHKGRDRVRRAVQLVLQEPDEQLFATSVFADVAYGPVNLELDEDEVEARVDKAMRACGVADLADQVPHQLSYGQRKQVALAGALAMQPRIVLLDEPTAGLDPRATSDLVSMLDRLDTVAFSTHNVDFAYASADRVAVLVDGGLVVGTPEEVLTDRSVIERARLSLPWAPAVSRLVGKAIRVVNDVW